MRIAAFEQIPEFRFWPFVEPMLDDRGCWEWIGAKSGPMGYGLVEKRNRQIRWSQIAHRYSWFLHFGEPPSGTCVLHRCDNPLCVNPSHLFLGSKKDNSQDMLRKNRGRWAGHDRKYRKPKQQKTCAWCSAVFLPKRSNAKYCRGCCYSYGTFRWRGKQFDARYWDRE